MAISALILSRDRPAQLDLLIRSMKQRAKGLFAQTHVLCRASTAGYEEGYRLCADYHRTVVFKRESDFRVDVNLLLRTGSDYSAFLCDDDVFWRPMGLDARPDDFLLLHPDVLTVSLRLGHNTVHCYPLDCPQMPPLFERRSLNVWEWPQGECDFAYPGSLDGNVWRRDQLRVLVLDGTWSNPNSLEDALNAACRQTLLSKVACYDRSYLVGNPVNSVQDAYHVNRHGETHNYGVADLNERFLAGERLALPSPREVNAAHQELPLEWLPTKVAA